MVWPTGVVTSCAGCTGSEVRKETASSAYVCQDVRMYAAEPRGRVIVWSAGVHYSYVSGCQALQWSSRSLTARGIAFGTGVVIWGSNP